jgi:predicted XRE-type DNA-binding protein
VKAPDHRVTALRRQLAEAITKAVGGKQGQHVIAPAYGIPQNRMSELARGRVHRHTMEWMIRRIHLMGGSVHLSITLGDVVRQWWLRPTRDKRKRQTVMPLRPYSLYGRGLDP